MEKIKRLREIIKELTKLVEELDKLTIRIISLFGWIVILIILVSRGI